LLKVQEIFNACLFDRAILLSYYFPYLYNFFIMYRLLLILFFMIPFCLHGQKENNVWYFGDSAGIDFNSTPPTALGNSAMRAYEGCASVCDGSGKLLFYSNGKTVWDKNHAIMPNGAQLAGDDDDAQAVLIIKQPGHQYIYYIFTNDRYNISYSIVDIRLNAGNGDVVTKNVLIQRSTGSEGMAATRHCNKKDFWIVAQPVSDAGTNSINAFLLTSQGLNPVPVTSSGGGMKTTMFGYIRFSPQGNKIALAKDFWREIFEFNNLTGRLGNMVFAFWYDLPVAPAYGFEFSPNGSMFYVPSYKGFLRQFDLSAGDSIAIKNTRYDISLGLNFPYAIVLAPDGKLYMTAEENGYLSVVNNPDVKGSGCNYKKNGFFLGGKKSLVGLPSVVTNNKGWDSRPAAFVSKACLGNRTFFSVSDSSGIAGIDWDVFNADGKVVYHSNRFQDSTILPDTGNYHFRAILHEGYVTDTVSGTGFVWPLPLSKNTDISFCPGKSIKLHATLPGAERYDWSTGSRDSIIEVSIPGTYSVSILRNGCAATSTFHVAELPKIRVALKQEYFICEDENEVQKLDAGKGFHHYRWYPTGDTTQWIIVSKTGNYYVSVEDFRGCTGEAGTIIQRRCAGYLYFPNVFTPNADANNDVFKPTGQDIISYKLRVYNRWGEKLFETDEIEKGWDGYFKGLLSPTGTYIWLCDYSLFDKKKQIRQFNKSGSLELLR
jgi:gliding motility-associated-like protein